MADAARVKICGQLGMGAARRRFRRYWCSEAAAEHQANILDPNFVPAPVRQRDFDGRLRKPQFSVGWALFNCSDDANFRLEDFAKYPCPHGRNDGNSNSCNDHFQYRHRSPPLDSISVRRRRCAMTQATQPGHVPRTLSPSRGWLRDCLLLQWPQQVRVVVACLVHPQRDRPPVEGPLVRPARQRQ